MGKGGGGGGGVYPLLRSRLARAATSRDDPSYSLLDSVCDVSCQIASCSKFPSSSMASSSSSLGLGDGIVLEALRKLFRHQKDGQDHTWDKRGHRKNYAISDICHILLFCSELSAAKELSDLSPDLILNLVSLALGVILSSGSHQAILHKSSFGKQLTAQLGGTPHTPTR